METEYSPNEPTQPVSGLPYDAFDSLIPPPPPPPLPPPGPSKHQRDIILGLILLCCLLVIALPLTAYFALYRPAQTSVITPTPTLSRATPTLDAKVGILSTDFPRFLVSFRILLERRDYATIATVVDTENFQDIALGTSSGPGDWNSLYQALTSGEETLMLTDPPLSPSQATDCIGYGPTSFEGYAVNALALQYVVGTTILSDTSSVPQRPANDDVFVFELPYGPSSYWTWRALTENNVAAPC